MSEKNGFNKADQNRNKSPQQESGETCLIRVKSIYNKHFPTDKRTYNYRIPIIGLSLSILACQYFLFSTNDIFRQNRDFSLICVCYIVVSCGTAFELCYGLKIGDRKQYSPWILQKLIEIISIIVLFILYYIIVPFYYIREHIPSIIYGIVVLVVDCILLYIVAKKSYVEFKGSTISHVDDENIYDNYDDV